MVQGTTQSLLNMISLSQETVLVRQLGGSKAPGGARITGGKENMGRTGRTTAGVGVGVGRLTITVNKNSNSKMGKKYSSQAIQPS